ncbi:MAG: FlgD immunoglobulin-like domain containing protein [Candidatus Latescibacterota bacterium]
MAPARLLPLAFALLCAAPALARVCGTQYLRQHAEKLALRRAKPSAAHQSAAPVKVGTQEEFLVGGDVGLRPATCRYVGEYCYVFVDDTQWDTNGGFIYQSDVDSLGALFDDHTPADPQRGIFKLASSVFGAPGDVDGDPRIYVLVLRLADPRLVGYFDPQVATYPDASLRRDTLYLSARHLRQNPYLARGTLAHELQHLIHFAHDDDEETWIDEGLSGYAELLTGFPETDPEMVPQFLGSPDLDLTAWPPGDATPHYGATYLFAAFLAERYGEDLLSWLVAEPRNGTGGLDQAFRAAGRVESFAGAWGRWILANYASDDDLYGYGALRGRRVEAIAAPPVPFDEVQGAISSEWGSASVLFRAPGNLHVSFHGENAGRYRLWGYAMRGSSGQAVDVVLEDGTRGAFEVAGVDSLVVVVGRASPQGRSFWLSGARYVPTVAAAGVGASPAALRLQAAYPNPFNGRAVLCYLLPAAGDASLVLYDAAGQRVRQLRQGWQEAGLHRVTWDACDQEGRPAASGVYTAVLTTGAGQRVERLTLVR